MLNEACQTKLGDDIEIITVKGLPKISHIEKREAAYTELFYNILYKIHNSFDKTK